MHDSTTLENLRRRFAATRDFAWPPEWPIIDAQHSAAVLIALQAGRSGLDILLTRRTDHLYHHPGQISFPGGRIETVNASPIHAALREADEEIGLHPDQVQVLGTLPDYGTSSSFRVTPVVGLVAEDFLPRLDAFEVAELIHLPLQAILNPNNFQQHRVQRANIIRKFHAIPNRGHFIWGATAGMLAMFAAFLSIKVDQAAQP